MDIGKLILYSNAITDRKHLISSLQEMGLLGQPMGAENNDFLAGERFLQLISFVGCSANVCLKPKLDLDGGFCHLTIKGPFDKPQLFWGKNSRPPRCPICKKGMHDWQNNIDSQTIKCIRCENLTRLEDIAWGRHAGHGRIFIQINNIFPGEAQPVHGLLMDLGRLTGKEWDYFFAEI